MDIELLPTGDWHTGSTTALHPNIKKNEAGEYKTLTELGGWFYTDNPNFYPSALQVRLWKHFLRCLSDVRKRRKGKKLFILKMGDEIDGCHHQTHQLITRHISEQVNTNIALMELTKQALGFAESDMLAYLQGTDVHTGIQEQEIGMRLNSMQFAQSVYVAPFLDITLNGVRIWAYHKGVSAGQGHTRGNACVNKLRQVYYECLQNGEQIPDLLITAHTHDQHSATWTRPDGKAMHYMITAPFQDKTRFAFDNLATNKNKVGMQTVTITGEGQIIINPPMLMASDRGYSVEVKR